MRTLLTTRGLLLALLVAAPALAAEGPATRPSAEALVRQFAEVRPPRFDQAKREDPKYVAGYEAEYKAFLGKRRGIARQFAEAYPGDGRAPVLLQFAAQAADDEKEKVALYRQLAARYPRTDEGKGAAGHVRRADAVGRPFELSFTDAISGRKVDVKELRGRVVLLDFWATWCPECVAAMPHLKELYAKYRERGLEIIGVNLDDPESEGGLAKMKAFVAENGIAWPQYYQGKGWESGFSASYGIDVLPAMFVVGRDGTLVSTRAEKELDALVERYLKETKGEK